MEKHWQNIGKDFLKVLKIVQKITKQKIFKKIFVKSADFWTLVYEKIRKYYLFLSWVFFFIKVVKEVKFFHLFFCLCFTWNNYDLFS